MPDQGNFCSGLWGYLRCIGNGAVVTSELTEISKCLIVVMFAAHCIALIGDFECLVRAGIGFGLKVLLCVKE